LAFGHKVHLNRLLANREHTDAIRLAGGVVASDLWTQIFCDVFELPIQTINASELGALGCAMAAAVAGGTYKDLREAAQNMVHIGETYEPDTHHQKTYREKFGLYESVSKVLKDQWRLF